MRRLFRSAIMTAAIAVLEVTSVNTASANGWAWINGAIVGSMMMNDAPRRMPCGFSGVPDDRCPGTHADLTSPTCQTILEMLGKADPADWHRRRDLVETAKRTGCAPYQR